MQVLIEPTPSPAEVEGVMCRIWRGHADNGAEVFLAVAALCVQDEPYLDGCGLPVARLALSSAGYVAEVVGGHLVLRPKEVRP